MRTNGGRNSSGQTMEDNEMFRTRKKHLFNTLLVELDGQTYTHLVEQVLLVCTCQRGQLYWTGYDGGNSVTLHYDFYSEGVIVTNAILHWCTRD